MHARAFAAAHACTGLPPSCFDFPSLFPLTCVALQTALDDVWKLWKSSTIFHHQIQELWFDKSTCSGVGMKTVQEPPQGDAGGGVPAGQSNPHNSAEAAGGCGGGGEEAPKQEHAQERAAGSPIQAAGAPPAVESADTLQDPRDVPAAPAAPAPARSAAAVRVGGLRSRSQRELDGLPGSQRESEMQELPQERDRLNNSGQDSNSRLRKLHTELERVVLRHEQEKASVQSWGTWLWQFGTLGNLLQAACAGVMILSLLISKQKHTTNLIVALILCSSLVLLLWVQHATFQRRVMVLGSRARRFLSRLEWYIKNPLEASTFGTTVAGGANVWLQTTRPISAVQVVSDNGFIALPTQLLVSGDRVVGPTDHWLVKRYCERSETNDATVRDTPTATQLNSVLSQPRRPQTQFEEQTKIVIVIIKWTRRNSQKSARKRS